MIEIISVAFSLLKWNILIKLNVLSLTYSHTVRRSSTKKSDYFTKRYSQPQLDTGLEFTYPANHPHQHTQSQSVNPVQSPSDVKCGLEAAALSSVAAENRRKPYLSRRSQIYRFSCDNCPEDYHSSSGDTVALGNRCTFAAAEDNFARNKMQSDSVSSSSTAAQNRCLTEHDGNEQAVVAANPVDLTTDNLPAVDTPDACDKAALR